MAACSNRLCFSLLQHVGCDLRIGSRKTVDACGVCGGDGSSCATPLYHWDTVPSSLCSEACGGGQCLVVNYFYFFGFTKNMF